jgi:uncharacterized membrane protein YfcA
VLLLAFAALTIVAAAAMLLNNASQRSPDNPDETESGPATSGSGRTGTAVETRPDTRRGQLIATTSKVVVCGTAVGFLTGFLGVGGGCLVVPALVIVLRMPMALAVGTSLLIIALNSISSVASRIGVRHLDWHVIAPFTIAALVGAIIGKRVADKLSGDAMTTSFAVMLVAVGPFVGIQSLIAL